MCAKTIYIITFFVIIFCQGQQCPSITNPVDDSEDIAPNTSISWNAVEGARGYFLLVGTTPGGRDLIDRLDVGNVLTHEPLKPFPENTIIYVKITVYFLDAPDNTCPVDRFTTGSMGNNADCTHFINPVSDFYACDYDLDGSESFDIDLDALESQLLGDQMGLEIRFYDIGGNLLSFTDDDLRTFENERTIAARAVNSEGSYKETTFQLILVEPPVLPEISDAVECEFYILPDLPNLDYKYFTETNGGGTELFAGNHINKSQTVYIYFMDEHCRAETNFGITIDSNFCIDSNDSEDDIFPKFFTPNGDGINDFFTIKGIQNFPNNDLQIFNRWGTRVFRQKGYKNKWDGSYDNQQLPDGTYFYLFKDGSGTNYSGFVQINR